MAQTDCMTAKLKYSIRYNACMCLESSRTSLTCVYNNLLEYIFRMWIFVFPQKGYEDVTTHPRFTGPVNKGMACEIRSVSDSSKYKFKLCQSCTAGTMMINFMWYTCH